MVRVSGISNAENNKVRTVRDVTVDDGKKGVTIGAVAGAIEGYTRKSWLHNNKPSDVFVKTVSKNLVSTLSKEEHQELDKVNYFFKSLVDYRTDVYSLKGRVEDSSELMNALPKKEGETAEQALERVFANDDKIALKKELLKMQEKTHVDKKVNKNTAKKIITQNFDSNAKILKQSQETSDNVFKVLKKSANKIKLNTAVAHTAVGGVVLGIIGLLIGANAAKTNQK